METFELQKSRESNIIKSIRFSEELNNNINKVIEKANKDKSIKQYSFNGFVCSSCEFALKHLPEELKED